MKLYIPVLLSLLSSATFFNAPALSMCDDDGPARIVRTARADADLDKLIRASGVVATYKGLRPRNGAPDEELIGYILRDSGWDKLNPEEQAIIVSKVTGKPVVTPLNALIKKSGLLEKFNFARGTGNGAPDEVLVAYLLGAEWDKLSPGDRVSVVSKVTGKPAVEAIPLPASSPVAWGQRPLPEVVHAAPADEVDAQLVEALRLSLQTRDAPAALPAEEPDADFARALELSWGTGGAAALPAEEPDEDFARILELSRRDAGIPVLEDEEAELKQILELSRQDQGVFALPDDEHDADLARALELSRQEKAKTAPKFDNMLEEFQQWMAQAGKSEDKHDATTTQFTLLRKKRDPKDKP